MAVAAHDVVWDAQRNRWAADVVLPPGAAYQPFVRLVLARYQEGSLAGVELSPVAAVEWAQLTPDRSATMVLDKADQTKVTLTVAGVSPSATAAAAGPNRVTVLIQTSARKDPGELDWETVGPPAGQVLASSTQGGTTLWTGTLTLPTARTQRPYRLVVTEHEQHHGGGRLVLLGRNTDFVGSDVGVRLGRHGLDIRALATGAAGNLMPRADHDGENDACRRTMMAELILFHHAQGRTPGVHGFADRLRAAGHRVRVPDLFEGATFPTVEAGVAHAEQIGFDTIIERGVAAADAPSAVAYAGFSMGALPAQKLAQTRPGALAASLSHAAVPASMFGGVWPGGVALQIHLNDADPWAEEDAPAAADLVKEAEDGELFTYRGSTHLFTDASLPDYVPESAELALERTLRLLSRWP